MALNKKPIISFLFATFIVNIFLNFFNNHSSLENGSKVITSNSSKALSNSKDYKIIGNLKWTDSLDDWMKKFPGCYEETNSTQREYIIEKFNQKGFDEGGNKFIGMSSRSKPYKSRNGVINKENLIAHPCTKNIGGVHFVLDQAYFVSDKLYTAFESYTEEVEFSVHIQEEFNSLAEALRKKYPVCVGDYYDAYTRRTGRVAICSKYSEYVFIDYDSRPGGQLNVDALKNSLSKIADLKYQKTQSNERKANIDPNAF